MTVRASIPTLFTAVGFLTVVLAILGLWEGRVDAAVGLCLIAFVLDMVDGFLARKLGTVSRFGAIVDTISDVFIYLVFTIGYLMTMYSDIEPWFYLVLGVFLAAGAFRLLRFTRSGLIEQNGQLYYRGAPVYYTIFLVLGLHGLTFSGYLPPQWLVALVMSVYAGLMVSSVPFMKPTRPSTLMVAGVVGLSIAGVLLL